MSDASNLVGEARLAIDTGWSEMDERGMSYDDLVIARAITKLDCALAAIAAEKARADKAEALLAEAVEALQDACSALDYIRYHYGELAGVGFDRVRDKHDAILARIKENGHE